MEHANQKPRLSVNERAERLLGYLEQESPWLGETILVKRADLLDVTDSENITEVIQLERYLIERGWIYAPSGTQDTLTATVTVDGHIHIADRATTTDSSQAFVAMWFHESTSAAYVAAIEPAIRDAGYTPVRIDQKEHINKIEDEIIAEIRRSRFVVADFTQGDQGARGGVYYEAGFAHGLGLPVILTCREDAFDTLHFDTSHYNHIVWSTPEELRDRLRNRILAVIGEGPEPIRAG